MITRRVILLGLLVAPLANCRCADLEGQSAYERTIAHQMDAYSYAQSPAAVAEAAHEVLADDGYAFVGSGPSPTTSEWRDDAAERQSRVTITVAPEGPGSRLELFVTQRHRAPDGTGGGASLGPWTVGSPWRDHRAELAVLASLDPSAAQAIERKAQRARDDAYDDAVLDGAAACGCRGLTK